VIFTFSDEHDRLHVGIMDIGDRL
ncbi:hypothetical protein BMETH_29741742375, partial [methanotrophic bacterial endosymbiont of Bathymodiolus sp.]